MAPSLRRPRPWVGCLSALSVCLSCAPAPSPPPPDPVPAAEPEVVPLQVHIDRTARTLSLHRDGQVERTAAIGVGRGGLGDKTAMSDLITPTGRFTVDLVLHRQGTHNAVADPDRLGDLSLAQLFQNMDGLDFDGDGAPDHAYGSVYVGLDGQQTGPKLRAHSRSGTPYWYSIALHATPHPENLGAANSGGCVHVDHDVLERLVHDGTLALGVQVVIADGPP